MSQAGGRQRVLSWEYSGKEIVNILGQDGGLGGAHGGLSQAELLEGLDHDFGNKTNSKDPACVEDAVGQFRDTQRSRDAYTRDRDAEDAHDFGLSRRDEAEIESYRARSREMAYQKERARIERRKDRKRYFS